MAAVGSRRVGRLLVILAMSGLLADALRGPATRDEATQRAEPSDPSPRRPEDPSEEGATDETSGETIAASAPQASTSSRPRPGIYSPRGGARGRLRSDRARSRADAPTPQNRLHVRLCRLTC